MTSSKSRTTPPARSSQTSPHADTGHGPFIGPRADERQRRRNIGRLLARSFEAFQARIHAGLHEQGFSDFTEADARVLRNTDLEGSRVTAIARRARITPQAANQQIAGLRRKGYVRVTIDASDHRARIVRPTARARRLIATGQAINRELENEWMEIIGATGLSSMHQLLGALLDGLEQRGHAPPGENLDG